MNASNASIDERDHDWFRRHLVGRALGLLDDTEEERFESLVARSDACRQEWEEYRGEEPVEGALAGHLPASVIARWDRARMRLRGIEREMVARHLELCDSCRGDLLLLGFEPTLETALAPIAPAEPRRGLDLRSLFLGVLGGGAAVAAALTLFLGQPSPDATIPGSVPWVTPTSLRGSTGAELLLSPEQTLATLLVEVPLGFDPARGATLTVIGPDGGTVAEDAIGAEALSRGLVLGMLERGGGWVEGRYTVRLEQTVGEGATPERADSSFDLRLH